MCFKSNIQARILVLVPPLLHKYVYSIWNELNPLLSLLIIVYYLCVYRISSEVHHVFHWKCHKSLLNRWYRRDVWCVVFFFFILFSYTIILLYVSIWRDGSCPCVAAKCTKDTFWRTFKRFSCRKIELLKTWW